MLKLEEQILNCPETRLKIIVTCISKHSS